ncbi:MAG: 50S ribosomal protein L6 [Thermodesulfobacteriota bacterium]
MSRIGKKPIPIPKDVQVELPDDTITVRGPRGSLSRPINPAINIVIEDGQILVKKKDDAPAARALSGLTRALVANMVTGVSTGFSKAMDLMGVGYRVELQGNQLVFNLGYSHPVNFTLPEHVSAKVEKQTRLILEGIDKELLGLTCDRIRRLRPPEPYKGKGIRYADEVIRKKAGKTGKK